MPGLSSTVRSGIDYILKFGLLCLIMAFVINALLTFSLLSLSIVLAVTALAALVSWESAVALVLIQIPFFALIPAESSPYRSIGSELPLLVLIALWIAKPSPLIPKLVGSRDPVQWGLLAVVIAIACSSVQTVSPFLSAYEHPWLNIAEHPARIHLLHSRNELFPLRITLTWVEGFLLYALLKDSFDRGTGAKIIPVLAIASLVPLIYATWESFAIDSSTVYRGVSRIRSLFEDPNRFADYLLGVIPLSFWCALRARGAPRWLWGALTLWAFGLLLLTFSRSAWLSITAGVLFLGLCAAVPGNVRKAAITGIVAFALVCAALVLSFRVTTAEFRAANVPNGIRHALVAFDPSQSVEMRTGGRLLLWEDGWRTFLAAPWTGIGTGQFFRTSPLRVVYPLSESNPYRGPHNFLLEIAAEQGMSGLIPALIALGFLLCVAVKPAGDSLSPGPFYKCSVIAVIVHAMFDQNFIFPEHLLLFFAFAAMTRVFCESKPPRTAGIRHLNPAPLLLGGAVILAYIVFAKDPPPERQFWRAEHERELNARALRVWERRGKLPGTRFADRRRAAQEVLFGLTPAADSKSEGLQ